MPESTPDPRKRSTSKGSATGGERTATERVQMLMKAGLEAAKAGRRSQAYRYFRYVTELDPQHEMAWLWRGGMADEPQETMNCLNRVLAINPRNQQAKAGIVWVRSRMRAKAGEARQTLLDSRLSHPLPTSVSEGPFPFRKEGSLPPPSQAKPSCWLLAIAIIAVALFLSLVGGILVTTVGAEAWRLVMATPTPTLTPTPTKAERISQLRQVFDQVWEAEQWPQAIEILERMQAIEPAYGGVRERLCAAHLLYGLELVEDDQLEEAIIQFDQALEIEPHERTAQRERQAAIAYLAGLESHRKGDWDRAVKDLSLVYDLNPDYKDVRSLLYSAHYNRGLDRQRRGHLVEAQAEYEQALRIKGHGGDAQTRLEEVTRLLTPPTSTSSPILLSNKRIEIDISEQHLYAWEEETLIYSFICSTGEPGRDTKPGQYRVRTKTPEAYASLWDLRMPYWLGIYPVGKYENGIHALPIVRSTGQKMWAGFLGQRVSYGCVVLSDESARLLYNWAEIGTPVIIRP